MVTLDIAENDLDAYALDRFAEPDAAPVEEHLLVCGECRGRLAAWDEYVAAMRAAIAGKSGRPLGRNRRLPNLAAGGCPGRAFPLTSQNIKTGNKGGRAVGLQADAAQRRARGSRHHCRRALHPAGQQLSRRLSASASI
jgi:anti-sigma factor RsiW